MPCQRNIDILNNARKKRRDRSDAFCVERDEVSSYTQKRIGKGV